MPDRYGVHVYDQAGVLQARFGDIGGLAWGGSDFTIPEGTFGFWARRDGAWMKAYVGMFYAVSAPTGFHQRTFGNPVTDPPPDFYDMDLEAVFPFGTISVPKGRVVTMEYFPHNVNMQMRVQSSGLWTGIMTNEKVKNVELRASLNGGGVASYNFLSGPTGSGDNDYTSVALRIKVTGQAEVDAGTYDAIRVEILHSIRLFSHEVNSQPTWSAIAHAGQTANFGRLVEGINLDQGGGVGTDAGGYQGGSGGGNLV